MPLFDTCIVVDWSAAAVPKAGRDSIWMAACTQTGHGDKIDFLENPRTRPAACDRLHEVLVDAVSRQRRVLVGFDFGFAYPAGMADALWGAGPASPWRRVWDGLTSGFEDTSENRNNRFQLAEAMTQRADVHPGPFWGKPRTHIHSSLPSTRPPFPRPLNGYLLQEYRLVEHRLREQGHYVQSMWKLMGAGAVGGQSLAGIPYLQRLRDDPCLAAHSAVWPFETDFERRLDTRGRPFVLFAEVWPPLFPVDASLHPVRDAAQVLTLARALVRCDARDVLHDRFAAPSDLTVSERDLCVREEGWILVG